MEGSSGAGGVVVLIIYLAIIALTIASFWVIFTKAGKPGWAAIVPIYNLIVLLEIAGKPAWWIVLFLIPIVSFIILIIVNIEVAKAFGKGTGFGIGLSFLGVVFYPMLAFGDATYQGTPAS